MRAPVLLAVLVVAAPFVVAPLVAAGPGADSREVVGNLVLDPRCPGYAQPATVACFDATGATAVGVVARGLANAQPRMLVQLQNDTVQWSIHWLCDDRVLAWGAENVTRVVVTLHADRDGCWDERTPLIAHGSVDATFS